MLHQAINQMLKKPLLVKKTEIGGLIREFRLLTGLTQEQFGAYLGVTYATINRWENGRSKPSPMAMDKIEQKLREVGEQGKVLRFFCSFYGKPGSKSLEAILCEHFIENTGIIV